MINMIMQKAIEYDKGDARRINHFMKVYAYAKLIGELEGLDKNQQQILEIAAVLHDIGIHESERKYNSSAGSYQQIEGPPIAEKILNSLNISEEIIKRVCYLISHHHTYTDIIETDYQILVEADFIVNIYEDDLSRKQIESIKEKIFRTKSGTEILCNTFNV